MPLRAPKKTKPPANHVFLQQPPRRLHGPRSLLLSLITPQSTKSVDFKKRQAHDACGRPYGNCYDNGCADDKGSEELTCTAGKS